MAGNQQDRRALPEGARFEETTARDGWKLRRFEWPAGTTPPRGSILFQTGRGDMIEKYFELLAHWHAAGWHISGFDWRGQGGSGRFLADPHIGHVDAFETWTGDLADFWSRWVMEAPAPHILAGHSMGGHLVLRTVMEHDVRPDGLLLSAPMLGFETHPLPVAWVAKIVELVARRWPERRAWRGNEKPGLPGASRQGYLTHDLARYSDELWWRETCPGLVLGPPSLGWLARAYRSCAWLFEPGRLEAVRCPALVVGTDADALVSPKAVRQAAARLRHAKLLMFGKEAAHEVFREQDAVRNKAIAAADAFLDQVSRGQ